MRRSIGRAASALVVAACAGLVLIGCAAPRGPLTAGGEQQAPPGVPWAEASSGSRACIPAALDEGSDFWFGNAHTNDGADDAVIRGVALRGADNLELVEAVVTGTEDAIGAVTDPWASGRSWERVPAAGATVPAGETVMVVVRVRPIDAAADGTAVGWDVANESGAVRGVSSSTMGIAVAHDCSGDDGH
ncbi:hypothetical protein [Agrococcus terreus]|uniref:Uncharacterized protein n=1 Tax=Agrococcus terreus TaxID=574649 RepID=A0ABQ2KRR7_9MICO|nr:hypothetical protein [Agrococcus terreus]GGN88137.1 hypothetical protein GCM10010968_23410 [Agrococcus terreus]